jgi:hypothetical protein
MWKAYDIIDGHYWTVLTFSSLKRQTSLTTGTSCLILYNTRRALRLKFVRSTTGGSIKSNRSYMYM